MLTGTELYHLLGCEFLFVVDEEEEFVLDDRTAKGEAVGLDFIGSPCSQIFSVNLVTTHILIAVVAIDGTLELVGTRLGHGVDTTTDEVGLTNIKGSDYHLHFLNGVDGNRGSATRQRGGQTKAVVEVGTIHREVRGTRIRTSEVRTATGIGRELCHIGQTSTDTRHRHHLVVVDVHRSTSLLTSELGSPSCHHNFCQLVGIFRDNNGEVVGLTQLQGYPLVGLCLETNIADGYHIRTTRTHTLDVKTAIDIRHGLVARTRRFMYSLHRGTDDFLTRALHHHFTTHT